tara:strand:+ start:206 stop:697 length:492 start_codon:yes stop_codon:yes gene_type:complete
MTHTTYSLVLDIEEKLNFLEYALEERSDRLIVEEILEEYEAKFFNELETPYEETGTGRAAKVARSYKHTKENCVAYQEGASCPDCYCDSTCTDDSCPICGGNTPARIDEQIEYLESVAAKKITQDEMLDKMCDEIEAECFAEDFDYDRERMKKRLQKILDSYK